MTEVTEEVELLQRISQGDRQAFAQLFKILAPKVKGYLLRLGSKPAAAEELTQDVMLTVWRKAEQFDPAKAGVLSWIFVIARNRRIDSLRRENANTLYGDPPDVEDETSPSQLDIVLATQHDTRVRAALQYLSPDQHEVVRRSFYEDETHSTIAQALDLPLGTVKSRLRLAMSKLRNRLQDLE